MAQAQRLVYFSGRVQGVGFRQTAVRMARDLPLSGTVRNLPDGRVELIVEGPAVEIANLVDRLREHFDGHVRNVEQFTRPLQGLTGPLRVAR